MKYRVTEKGVPDFELKYLDLNKDKPFIFTLLNLREKSPQVSFFFPNTLLRKLQYKSTTHPTPCCLANIQAFLLFTFPASLDWLNQ